LRGGNAASNALLSLLAPRRVALLSLLRLHSCGNGSREMCALSGARISLLPELLPQLSQVWAKLGAVACIY
jgi:hypothetical protein